MKQQLEFRQIWADGESFGSYGTYGIPRAEHERQLSLPVVARRHDLHLRVEVDRSRRIDPDDRTETWRDVSYMFDRTEQPQRYGRRLDYREQKDLVVRDRRADLKTALEGMWRREISSSFGEDVEQKLVQKW